MPATPLDVDYAHCPMHWGGCGIDAARSLNDEMPFTGAMYPIKSLRLSGGRRVLMQHAPGFSSPSARQLLPLLQVVSMSCKTTKQVQTTENDEPVTDSDSRSRCVSSIHARNPQQAFQLHADPNRQKRISLWANSLPFLSSGCT